MEKQIGLEQLKLKKAIMDEYTELADNPDKKFHFWSGWPLTQKLGYHPDWLEGIPEGAFESFAGVGNPFEMGLPQPNQTVVDIGCGAGMDVLIASKFVQGGGLVIGVDMTPAMLEKAQSNALNINATNTKFYMAEASALPFGNEMADLVISNGVINLIPDKVRVFAEVYRILKYGAKVQLADVLLERPVPESSKERVHLWTTCVAGGLLHEEYAQIMLECGFKNIEITKSFQVFEDAPVASSALKFGARGYNIQAEK
ncbi:MAG TPA: methyltransferase domain-containing protein [Saprospiraceae bacterium]|nr:methyltransferase domain-containing protein [Saprospiraceae bacterium]